MSGRDEPAVRAGLAELLRREVLSVSADPLSPERGSYQFAQQMLRQVAYDTLSRRDRKARHLAVAAHLRAAFPGDGEEVADVIARHYLDALQRRPRRPRHRPDPRPGHRRADPGRRTRRTHRRPGPRRHQLRHRRRAEPEHRRGRRSAVPASCGNAPQKPPSPTPLRRGDRARGPGPRLLPAGAGQPRAAARAQAIAGRALRHAGPATPKRAISSPPPWTSCGPIPTPTRCRPWSSSATLEVFAGSPDADQLTTEALVLGQALDVGPSLLCHLFTPAGSTSRVPCGATPRRPPTSARAARLAEPGRRQRSSWDERC